MTICTSNADKAKLLGASFAELGMATRVVTTPLDEPQADSVVAVARAKAAQAFARHGGPVVVEDSGLAITELGDFPGPYTKYALASLGARGLVALAAGMPCRFTSATAVAHGDGAIAIGDHGMAGTIARTVAGSCDGSWSDLWRVFIPDGQSLAFSELPPPLRADLLEAWRAQLTAWLRATCV